MWLAGFLSSASYSAIRWKRLRALTRRARPVTGLDGLPRDVAVRIAQDPIEPGVFGILRPVLLLPASIFRSLSGAQLRAVLAHEHAHIRRRDNLWSALHMAVEALFWFHPLVWWLGGRILEDRERACDEAVIDSGCDPEAYAESLLQVCRQYLAQSPRFVAYAAGSGLKRRVAGIMTHDVLRNLTAAHKIVLACLAVAAIAVPIAAGLAAARPIRAQEPPASPPPPPDVVSVKPNDPKDSRIGMYPSPGRLVVHNYTLRRLIRETYRLKDFQLDGANGWMDKDSWDIEGVFPQIAGKSAMQLGTDRLPAMLADRFHLVTHRETRQLPVYTLVITKNGPKLTKSDPNNDKPGTLRVLPSKDPAGFTGTKMDFLWFTNLLSGELNLPVVDKTGITGLYDITLSYTPQRLLDAPDYAGNGISVFTALQQQLGLKLEESKGPVEVLVVDHAEKPSAN